MVKVVAAVSGIDGAWPERLFSEKVPSEETTTHDSTPFASQKILVLKPLRTDSGTAQTSTFGFTYGFGGGATVFAFVEEDTEEVAVFLTAGCPTGKPRKVQMESKNVAGTMNERKFEDHGRVLHIINRQLGLVPFNAAVCP